MSGAEALIVLPDLPTNSFSSAPAKARASMEVDTDSWWAQVMDEPSLNFCKQERAHVIIVESMWMGSAV